MRVSGSEAVQGPLDLLSAGDGLVTVLGARARAGQRGAGWREGVEKSRSRMHERMPTLCQLTIRRQASVLASHPPAGLRHAIVGEGTHRDAAVVLTDARAADIDAELSTLEEGYRRDIAASW